MARILSLIGGMNLRLGAYVNQADIVHLKQYYNDRFRFEWHQKAQRLYCIDLVRAEKAGASVGNLIGTDLPNQGAAHNAMLIWLRGYRAGAEDLSHNDQGKLIILGDK